MKTIDEIINHLKLQIEEVLLNSIDINLLNGETIILDLGIDSLDFAYIMISGETFVNGKVRENDIDWRNVRTIYQLSKVLYDCQKDSK